MNNIDGMQIYSKTVKKRKLGLVLIFFFISGFFFNNSYGGEEDFSTESDKIFKDVSKEKLFEPLGEFAVMIPVFFWEIVDPVLEDKDGKKVFILNPGETYHAKASITHPDGKKDDVGCDKYFTLTLYVQDVKKAKPAIPVKKLPECTISHGKITIDISFTLKAPLGENVMIFQLKDKDNKIIIALTKEVPFTLIDPKPPIVIPINTPPTCSILAPSTGKIGRDLSFIAKCKDKEGFIKDYVWYFDYDKSTKYGSTITHSFGFAGKFTVKFTAFDDEGASRSYYHEVLIPDPSPRVKPVAVVKGSTTAKVGEDVPFDGSSSYDPKRIVIYHWDLGDGTKRTGHFITYNYPTPGTYPVTLTVEDKDGLIGISEPHYITISGFDPPVASFICTPLSGKVGTTVTCDASSSYDIDGDIVEYHWSFGDGDTRRGNVVSNHYNEAGAFTIRLTVADTDKLSSFKEVEVSIFDSIDPVSRFNCNPDSGKVGITVTCDASSSYDTDGKIAGYHWDFGDGSTKTGDKIESHIYRSTGNFRVSLTVTDTDLKSNTSYNTVSISDIPKDIPIAILDCSSDSGKIGITVTCNAGDSYDPDGGIITNYFWNIGDGNTKNSRITQQYDQEGNFEITLQVKDDEGQSSNLVSHIVEISSLIPPQPDGRCTIDTEKNLLSCDGRDSRDPDGTILEYEWKIAGGRVINSDPVFTIPYSGPDDISFELTVTDNDRQSRSMISTPGIIVPQTYDYTPAAVVGTVVAAGGGGAYYFLKLKPSTPQQPQTQSEPDQTIQKEPKTDINIKIETGFEKDDE